MNLRLAGLHVRAAFVLAFVAALFGAPMTSPLPLPIALLASFDEAFDLVSVAAEQRIVALEERSERLRPDARMAAVFARIDRKVTAACDAARASLDHALATAARSPDRRAAVLATIDHLLAEARRARDRAADPTVGLEYHLTCLHLCAIRALV